MGKYEIKGEGRRKLALLLALSLIQIAVYYLAAAWVNGSGSLPSPQPDTLLYCQAARRICEGHAFSFTAGNAVSTGTTSVLYPFVLAIPRALGATGGSLLTAGFFLNAVFYLIFVFCWSGAFRRWLPRAASDYASLLLVLFPQTAYCALAQSDTGLWMAVSAVFALGLAAERAWVYGPMLALGPWVRPEGAMLLPFFALVALVRRSRRDVAWAAVAALSVGGVFALNHALTGVCGFSSVAQKGYFASRPFAAAVLESSSQAFAVARELFFGQASTLPRGLYTIPLVGSLAMLAGLAFFDWRRRWVSVGVLAGGACLSLAAVAQSGWQGSNCDRYFAWLMPLLVMFTAVGWRAACDLLAAEGEHQDRGIAAEGEHQDRGIAAEGEHKAARGGLAKALLAVPVVYTAGAAVCCCFFYHISCSDTERLSRFAVEIDREIPDRDSVGVSGWCGLAYWLGERKICNLGGIYTPELTAGDVAGVLEILKNEPATRFDHWLVAGDEPFPKPVLELMKETELTGPDAFRLKKTDWTAFDRALAAKAPEGRELKCRVDVGYERDERRAGFEIVTCYGMRPFRPLIAVADLDGAPAVDCGRLVIGYSEMEVDGLEPGKDVTVTVRVADEVKAESTDAFGSVYRTEYGFKGHVGLHLSVDGAEVACCHAEVTKPGFTELELNLPGRFITADRHRIGIHGDHAAFEYRFYQ